MKLFTKRTLQRRLGIAAFTIVEMWMSMAVGSMCLGSCSVIYLMMAKQHRAGLADSIVEERIDNLQDKLTSFFRTKSATVGVTLGGSEGTNSNIYRIALVSDGGAAIQEAIYLDKTTGSVKYRSNFAQSGTESVFWGGETNKFQLQDLYFTLGLKEGYRPSGDILDIHMKVNDDFAARRRSGNTYSSNVLQRCFTVRLRGP